MWRYPFGTSDRRTVFFSSAALADEPFPEPVRCGPARLDPVASEQLEHRLLAVARLSHEEGSELGVDQRRELGHDQAGDRLEVALALQGCTDACEVGLQPVLLLVLDGGLAQVGDHLVDVVLEIADLAGGIDGDRPVEAAPRDRRRHVGDRADLGREVAGELVHVLGQTLPCARDTLHLGLAAELAFGPHLACHTGDLTGKGGELVDHLVDGVLELKDLAAGVDRDLL
jgi:hypothetical protein